MLKIVWHTLHYTQVSLQSRNGTVVRALAYHHHGPGLIPRPGITCGLSLSLVPVFAARVFLWPLQFSSLHQNQHSKFQFDLEIVDKKNHLVECLLLNSHLFPFPFIHSQDLISNSPYYLPYNSYNVSSENLVLDQLIIP